MTSPVPHMGCGLSGGSATAGGYRTFSSDYDGTNDDARRGADLTGIVDGKAGTFSCWLRLDGGDGGLQHIIATNTAAGTSSRVFRNTTNTVNFSFRNAADTIILGMNSSTTYTASATWLHILASWDLAAGVSHLFISDADVEAGGSITTDDTIDYTEGNFAVGSLTGGGSKLNGCLSELFFHTTYIDISTAANRRKFISPSGKPVFLGADGSIPLGAQPLLYAPNGNPSTNRGSGGNFAITGSLDVGSTSPSD